MNGLDRSDWTAIRARFPALARRVWLDTASMGLLAQPVREVLRREIDSWNEGTAAWHAWDTRAEEARELFARVLGADRDQVALLNSLSAAASQVAESLAAPARSGGANIVVGRDEFQSNLFPWMNQERRGFEVRLVPYRDGAIRVADLIDATDSNTALIAVSHVQSASGYRIALGRLAQATRERRIRLFVDATQSLGALRVPLEGIDFVAAAAYKWLLCPRGTAFLYVAAERLEETFPLQPSWKTPEEVYARYYGPPFELAKRASRLDVSLPGLVWLGAVPALALLQEVGPAAIEERDLELAARFRAGLRALGLEPLFTESESSPIVALRVRDPKSLCTRLERERIVAAVRGEYLRTSFHFYNDEEDVERALSALRG